MKLLDAHKITAPLGHEIKLVIPLTEEDEHYLRMEEEFWEKHNEKYAEDEDENNRDL